MDIKPTSEILVDLNLEPTGSVQRELQSLCYKYMDKYVPRYEGNLRKNVDLSNPYYIVYESPYARYQYYGRKMVMPENGKSAFYSPDYGFWSIKGGTKVLTKKKLKYHTKGTGPFWDKKMWTVEKKKLIKDLQNFVDHGG